MQTRSRSAEIGARLKLSRDMLGLSGTEFARRAGIAQNAYSQFETGKRMLTVTAALRIRRAHGLTLDYLFDGDISGLPHRLAGRLATPPPNQNHSS